MNVYLDHASTTPIFPEVVAEMLPILQHEFGNPSSLHSYGRAARALVDEARAKVAMLLGVREEQIIFTSGGTESIRLAFASTIHLNSLRRQHVITSAIEHHATLATCRYLESVGVEVTYLPVDSCGRVDPTLLRAAIKHNTKLISIMHGNNEVGTLQPIAELAKIAQESGIMFHTDVVQSLAYYTLADIGEVDFASLSGHKINGPKGVGVFYMRSKGDSIHPTIFGGLQESGRRGGTENVAGIVGFAKALELTCARRSAHLIQMQQLRQQTLAELRRANISFLLNGHPTEALPHILNLTFPGIDPAQMVINYDLAGIACSLGSACSSGTMVSSHVLAAMDSNVKNGLRFSFGYGNTLADVRLFVAKTAEILQKIVV